MGYQARMVTHDGGGYRAYLCFPGSFSGNTQPRQSKSGVSVGVTPWMEMVARPDSVEAMTFGFHDIFKETDRVKLFMCTVKTKFDRQRPYFTTDLFRHDPNR